MDEVKANLLWVRTNAVKVRVFVMVDRYEARANAVDWEFANVYSIVNKVTLMEICKVVVLASLMLLHV